MTTRSVRAAARHTGATRAGFTLLETILALSLTALVLAIAGFALRTASDARQTIALHQEREQAEARFRSALVDMLRHAPASSGVDEPLLAIENPRAGTSPATALVFLSRGVLQPFGTGRIWRVRLSSSERGTTMSAEPVADDARETPVTWTLRDVAIASIDVLERANAAGEAPRWRADWMLSGSRPALIRVSLTRRAFSEGGRASRTPMADRALAPLVVDLAPVGGN